LRSADPTVHWWNDRFLRWTLFAGVLLRAIPLMIWGDAPCAGDECTYIQITERMLEGRGMTGSAGWLWAPGYPALMSFHAWITGSYWTIRVTQVGVAFVNMLLLFAVARRLIDERAARIAVLLYALSPSLAFFAISLWSETLYTSLLLGAVLALLKAREHGGPWRAVLVGVLIGGCVLFRGIATYMLPCFVIGLIWGRWREIEAWGLCLALVAGAVATVAPYSVYISQKYDAFVISDRTLGQMMWLGNNTFEPLTWDYGYGRETRRDIRRHIATGRERCAPQNEPMRRDSCETRAAIEWIEQNPEAFIRRIPLKLAQTISPHSFLTRHLRWGRWSGISPWMTEVIIGLGALASLIALIIGALGMAARVEGGTAWTITAVIAYHAAAIALTAGLSRYRVPLEPLLIIYAAGVLAHPRETMAILSKDRWRGGVAAIVMVVVTPLVLWLLPAGWPEWQTW